MLLRMIQVIHTKYFHRFIFDLGHAAYSVSGYPTIFWVKNGDKTNPQKYQGGRSVDDFKKWVKENRSTPPKDEL